MIREGDTVIVRMHDDESSHMLHVRGEQKLFKKRLQVDSLIGAPYGSIFQMDGMTLTRVPEDRRGLEEIDPAAADEDTADSGKPKVLKGDNSNYNDTNTSQKMSNTEIERLKESGVSGDQIIQSLIANSDTWNAKTEFAQEKWLKKKQQKYIKRMRIMETTPLALCEVYHAKSRDKICGLRHDSLAQIISHSGVHAGCRVLVVESCVGLVVGSIATRMQGAGAVLALYTGQQPHFELVDALNLSDDAASVIQPFSSTELTAAVGEIESNGFAAASAAPPPHVPEVREGDGDANKEKEKSLRVIKAHNKTGRKVEDIARVRHQLRMGANSLVIACRYNILPILKKALLMLMPSSPFVLYCEFMEPLVECYLYLIQHGLAIRVVTSDTWMREFQTLPGRVHPQMYMTTSSGYILSGVYVGRGRQVAASSSGEMSAAKRRKTD